VSFTANLQSYSTDPASSYLVAVLTNCAPGNIPRVISTGVKAIDRQRFDPDATGLISKTITPNGDIVCGTATGQTQYRLEIWQKQYGQPDRRVWYAPYVVGPGAFDLKSANQASSATNPPAANAVITNPTGSQTVNQPTGTTLGVTGAGSVDMSQAGHTSPTKTGTLAARPVNCLIGEEYNATDVTLGQNKYICTATNTWTQQGQSSSPTAIRRFYPAETPNGVNLTFTFGASPASGTNFQLMWNGVLLDEGNDFTLSGAIVTMTRAPKTGDRIVAYF
jgi:hypothetical protein